jgi:ligand-binding SRPBCC domain-containing protein
MPMLYELTDAFEVSAAPDDVWRFFSDARNLAEITPPWLNFTITTREPGEIGRDSVLDYTIRWLGIPVRWRTLITEWDPPHGFTDLQIGGPYALWHHQHRFAPAGGGAVRCTDRVLYRLPLGVLGGLAHAAVVRRQLIGIFAYRREAIAQRLGDVRPQQERPLVRRI